MKINDIFFELANEFRYKLLKEIFNKPCRNSYLSKKLNLPGSEITRHLKRLAKYNLIIKKTDNKYYITKFGTLIVNDLKYFEFLTKFDNFLNTHNIEFIPQHIKMEMGKILNAKLLINTMENIELWSQIIKGAKNYIWAITDQLQYSIIPIIQQKITTQKLEIKSILGSNLLKKLVYTDEWEIYIKGPKPQIFQELYKLLKIPDNIRKINKIELSLIITESEGIIFFSNNKGIDYSECIYSKNDSDFIEWTTDLFKYFWDTADKMSIDEILPKNNGKN